MDAIFNPPRVLIVLELEAKHRVHIEANAVGERAALEDWIDAHDEYQPLLRAVRDLVMETTQ
jgi:hypothetical protein